MKGLSRSLGERKRDFCDWVRNWTQGIDEDFSPIAQGTLLPGGSANLEPSTCLWQELCLLPIQHEPLATCVASKACQFLQVFSSGHGYHIQRSSLPSRLETLEKC